jgi:hypothetical protein
VSKNLASFGRVIDREVDSTSLARIQICLVLIDSHPSDLDGEHFHLQISSQTQFVFFPEEFGQQSFDFVQRSKRPSDSHRAGFGSTYQILFHQFLQLLLQYEFDVAEVPTRIELMLVGCVLTVHLSG